jgi:hypothetical protein
VGAERISWCALSRDARLSAETDALVQLGFSRSDCKMGSSCSSLLKRNSGVSEPEGEFVGNDSGDAVSERPTIIQESDSVGPPSLTACAVRVLARHFDSLGSLHGVPQELVQQIFSVLVKTRLLQLEHLRLLVSVKDARLESYVALNDEWLQYFGRHYTGLTRLNLGSCFDCTDDGSKHLTGLEALTNLNVDRCLRLGDASLQSFAHLTNLRLLSLSGEKTPHQTEGASSFNSFSSFLSYLLVCPVHDLFLHSCSHLNHVHLLNPKPSTPRILNQPASHTGEAEPEPQTLKPQL